MNTCTSPMLSTVCPLVRPEDLGQQTSLVPQGIRGRGVVRVPRIVRGPSSGARRRPLHHRRHPDVVVADLLGQHLAEGFQRGLGGDVHRQHRERVQRRLARRVDDVTAAGGPQERYGGARGVHRAEEVGRHLAGDVLVAEQLDGAGSVDGGVIDEHVDRPEAGCHLFEGRPHAVGVADVGGDRHDGRPELAGHILETWPGPGQHHDGRALLDEAPGNADARSARGARDDGDLPLHASHRAAPTCPVRSLSLVVQPGRSARAVGQLVAQHPPQQLAGRRVGELVAELNDAGHFG